MTYRADIDGLRAVAVLLVLIFHFNIVNLGSAGFMGVDIFFVISGYLISQIIWRDLDRQTFSFATFYARRIRRLAPPLFVTQALAFVAAWFLLMPAETSGLSKEMLASQLYVSNFYYWRSINYFGLAGDRSFMLHTWSLAVEEQFYLLFPLFVVLVHRWRPKALPIALIALFVISFVLDLAFMRRKPEADFYLLPGRAWEFALGALIPFAVPILMRLRGAIWPWLTGVALIALAMILYVPTIPFPGWFALLPTLGAASIILSGERPGSLPRRIMSWPPLVAIGRISYSLYLVHWPIHVFATFLLVEFTLAWRWAAMALSFVLAGLMYVFVERPVRQHHVASPASKVILAYLGGLAVATSIAGATIGTGGWPQRFSPELNGIAAATNDRDTHSIDCEWRDDMSLIDRCRIGATDVAPTWLLFGDSHSAALRQAFSVWLTDRGEAGLFTFKSGCLPLPDTGGEECRSFNRQMTDLLVQRPNLRNVILASPWRQPIEPNFVDDAGQIVSGDGAIAAFDKALHERLAGLAAMGRTTIIWEPVPGARLSVPDTVARDEALGWHRDIMFSRTEYEQTYAFAKAGFDRHAALIAGRVNVADTICRSGECAIMQDGHPLYSDFAHPAFSQTGFFAEIIAHDLSSLPRQP